MASTAARVLGGVAVMALAACSAEPGDPTPAPGNSSQSAPTTTAAPTTTTSTKPREVRLDREQLCGLLTAAEAARFGSKNPRPTNSFRTGNPQCGWMGEMSLVLDFTASGTITPETGAGITNTDIEVAGLPALLYLKTEDGRGFCQVVVALNEDRSYLSMGAGVLSAGEGKGYDPCEVAKQVAEIVIPKVKG